MEPKSYDRPFPESSEDGIHLLNASRVMSTCRADGKAPWADSFGELGWVVCHGREWLGDAQAS